MREERKEKREKRKRKNYDPKNDALVPGDVRYNIIEWDMTNLATYGGLGPSIGHQFTGLFNASRALVPSA